MTNYPTELVRTERIRKNKKSENLKVTYKLVNDKYYINSRDDKHYVLVVLDYHCDHMSYMLYTTASEFKNNGLFDDYESDTEFVDDYVQESTHDMSQTHIVEINDLELFLDGYIDIELTSNGDEVGQHDFDITTVFSLGSYLKNNHAKLYEKINKNIDMTKYRNLRW